MKARKAPKKSRLSKNAQNPHPQSTNYYLYFSKASAKAGTLATKAFFQVKDLFSREIALPQTKDFTDIISKIIPKPAAGIPKRSGDDQNDTKRIVEKTNQILAEATTVFPFTLFPDTITLDRRKLTMTRRNFFWSSKVLSIQVEEILNISAGVGPFFGSLNIAIRGLTSQDHFNIDYLWRKDAIHIKHMIQGYIIALKDDIKIDHLSRKELIAILAELGRDSNPEKIKN
jgi:hypothetical protein